MSSDGEAPPTTEQQQQDACDGCGALRLRVHAPDCPHQPGKCDHGLTEPHHWTWGGLRFDCPLPVAAERAAALAVIERRHAQVIGAAEHPLLRAVLELHAPVFGDYDFSGAHCEGCEASGYDAEYAEFPCQTYALIAPTPASAQCACDCHSAHSYGMACSLISPCCEYAGSDSGGTQ